MDKIDLLGCVIGDGYVSEKGALTIRHSYKQREYLEYKYLFCKEIYKDRKFNIIDVPQQNGVQIGICDAAVFKDWRKLCYPDGKKKITQDLLKKLTKQAIAFWFCDDGSTSFKKSKDGKVNAVECVISTYCSEKEVDLIIKYFKFVWGITMTKKRNKNLYSIRFGTREGRKFVRLFDDFIPECMKYKTNKLKNFIGSYEGFEK